MDAQGHPDLLSFAPRPEASNPAERKNERERSQKDEKGLLHPGPAKVMNYDQRLHISPLEFCSVFPTRFLPGKPSYSEFNKLHPQKRLSLSLSLYIYIYIFFFFLGLFVESRIKRIFSHFLLYLKPCFPEGVGNAERVMVILQILRTHTHTSPWSIKLGASADLQKYRPAELRFILTEFVSQVEP